MKSLSFTIATPHETKATPAPIVHVFVTEEKGGLRFDLQVEANKGYVADLRGLFFQVEKESLVGSFKVTGDLVTGFAQAEDAVATAGKGKYSANVEGVKTGPFDLGLAFGSNGIGEDDVRQTSFLLTSSKGALDLGLLDHMDFAARLTSFGLEGGKRADSLKMVGTSGDIAETCPSDHGAAAPAPVPPPAPEPVAPAVLSEIVIGDNLYGNGGRDTFVFEKGDGVDLIWDFEAGQDLLVVKGYSIADVDAFTFVSKVTNPGRDGANPLDAGSHQKLALILDKGGDAIVFNDLGDRNAAGPAVKFDDGTLNIAELIAKATPSTAPVAKAAPGDNVDAVVAVTNAWWGGFQAEIKVTAKEAVTDWDVLLGTKWNLQTVWGATKGEVTATAGGVLVDLNDADWNGHLAAGQTATIGFTATTGFEGILGTQQILSGIWIG